MGSSLVRRLLKEHGLTVVLICQLLFLSWLIIYASGGANTVPPHLIYAPVLFAGWRMGVGAAVVTAAVGGVLSGPLLPADVSGHVPQPLSDWVLRLSFFLAIGTFMAVIMQKWKAAAQTAVHAAHRERDLAVRESAFLQCASHEIRTPLTVILGVVSTLEQRRLLSATAEPLMESLKRAAGRLDRLSMMALASAGAAGELDGDAEPLDLCELMAEIVREIDPRGAGHRIRLLVPQDARLVRSRPRLLRPALSALVDNALKFSPPSKPVEIGSSLVDEGLSISIRDFGTGMDPTFIERAFDPFTQSDGTLRRQHEGLGIGLFASRRLAEQLGGRLKVTNHPEGGLEASLILPRTAAEPGAGPSIARAV